MYALAVELNILQRILVSHFDIPDEVYAELRRKARAEVAVSRKGAQIESVQAQMLAVIPDGKARHKMALGQRFLNTVLHLFGSLFQLHFFQLGHHSFRFFTGGLLAFLGMDRLEHLGH